MHGYLITAANVWQRALLVVGGLLLIKPGLETDLIGAALALRRDRGASAGAPQRALEVAETAAE